MNAKSAGIISVKLPDGSGKDIPDGSTVADLASLIGSRLAQAAVAGKVDGVLVDLGTDLYDGAEVAIVTGASDEGRSVLRHSTAHVLAQAVTSLWPGARYAIGPAIADGFYYDFELIGGEHFSEEHLSLIDARMREIISQGQAFVRQELTIEQGLEIFADQPYKSEIIQSVATRSSEASSDVSFADEEGVNVTSISVYRNEDKFVDLCRGPHVLSTDRLGHFALQRVAGAYWRGDEKRPQLQRIYGTAFESAAALAEHLDKLAEAERRDHRRLGLELDLFSFPDEIGSGLAVFHPKGGLVRRLMEDYSRKRHEDAGYSFVYSPHITKAELFQTSQHLQWFADGMFPPMELDGGHQYYLKPMNCPFHILVYRSRQRSYRELPLRLFELGTVYRNEKSGVIHGLTRVRGMTMDDSHIFCTQEQMESELTSVLHFVLELLRDFGLSDFFLELSTRPEGKAVGSDEEWAVATKTLADVAGRLDLDLVADAGGGAFYGPKISIQARDAIGRTWQMSTIQVDFQLPRLFDLRYIGADNERHRPVMIHRALFGSVERFFAVLLEHYAGALPTWLAPVQARVLPVRDMNGEYAKAIAGELAQAGLRVEADNAEEPLGARVRRAKMEKIPYVLVVGDQDEATHTVGVNMRDQGEPERGVAVQELLARMQTDIARLGREAAVSQ